MLSHYLPGGQADLSPQPVETVYVLVGGELTMVSDGRGGRRSRAYDSVHFTPGTVREVVNREPAAGQHARHPAGDLVTGLALPTDLPRLRPGRHAARGRVLRRHRGHLRRDGPVRRPGRRPARPGAAAAHRPRPDALELPARVRPARPGPGRADRAQEVLAHRLIAESMSIPAYARVVQVMSNEHVLRELNLPVFGHVAATFRDARGYFLTFFGQPQPDTTWGWRLVGHHLSLNVTVVDGDLLTATPFLLGAEPARFGPFRILGEEEDAAFVLLDSLTAAQRSRRSSTTSRRRTSSPAPSPASARSSTPPTTASAAATR